MNVDISLTLLCRTIEFLEGLDAAALTGVDDEFFAWLLASFQAKARESDTRACYARACCAPDEASRNAAHKAYLQYTDF